MVARDDVVDVLVRDGESLVLTSNRCVRLTQVSTALLLLLDGSDPRPVEEIESHLEAMFGAPAEGDLADMVGAVIVELRDLGIVREHDEATEPAPDGD